MYLLLNRMNTNNFFIILKPLNSSIRHQLAPTACLSNNQHKKHFHLSQFQNDSNDDKKAKKSKLANFSFIQLNKNQKPNESENKQVKTLSTQIEDIVEGGRGSPSVASKKDTSTNPLKETFKQTSVKYNQSTFLNKIQQSSVNRNKRSKSTENLNPTAAIRLAKMIDPKNSEKTAELLTEPVTQKRDTSGAKQAFNLRRVLDSIKAEPSRPSSINFKNLMKSSNEEYSMLNSQPLNREIKVNTQENRRDEQHKFLRGVVRTESYERRMRPFDFNKIVQFTGTQEGDRFQMQHRLNGGQGLMMFSDQTKAEAATMLDHTRESPVWEMHYVDQLTDMEKIPPINGFEEMIMLTKEGKLWNFPIDNEQGVDEQEAEVSFVDHVFLDNYLEEFPDIAPIQEFMTLALNGLSKNGFLSVDEKKAIVEWYKDYFKEKEDLIREALGAEQQEAEYREKLAREKERS